MSEPRRTRALGDTVFRHGRLDSRAEPQRASRRRARRRLRAIVRRARLRKAQVPSRTRPGGSRAAGRRHARGHETRPARPQPAALAGAVRGTARVRRRPRCLAAGIDTSTSEGRLFFQIIGAIAEFERDPNHQRTLGLAAAPARGRRRTVSRSSQLVRWSWRAKRTTLVIARSRMSHRTSALHPWCPHWSCLSMDLRTHTQLAAAPVAGSDRRVECPRETSGPINCRRQQRGAGSVNAPKKL